MRTSPLTFVEVAGIQYAQLSYARLNKHRDGVVVVPVGDEDGDVARQAVPIPAGQVVVGFGPGATPTAAGARKLAELGVRSVSTVGAPGGVPADPFSPVELAFAQARSVSGGDTVARRLYSARLGEEGPASNAPFAILSGLDTALVDEVYARHVDRFRPTRYKRDVDEHPVNQAVALSTTKAVQVAFDVCRLLNLNPALGVLGVRGPRSFAAELASCFQIEDLIPIGFFVGSRKIDDPDAVEALVDEELHERRLLPRMVDAAHGLFSGLNGSE